MGAYAEARRTSPRMFKRAWMEACTHVHPVVPWLLSVPAAGLAAWLASRSLAAGTVALLALAGLASWSLMEYLLHRFLFHYHPRSAWGKKLFFTIHGVHHDYPDDATRLVMPPVLSIPMGLVVFGALWLGLGATGAALFVGLAAGYLAYDTIHYAVHHFPLRSRLGKALRAQHMRHHFKEPDRGFGVSSPAWDVVFRTRFRKRT